MITRDKDGKGLTVSTQEEWQGFAADTGIILCIEEGQSHVNKFKTAPGADTNILGKHHYTLMKTSNGEQHGIAVTRGGGPVQELLTVQVDFSSKEKTDEVFDRLAQGGNPIAKLENIVLKTWDDYEEIKISHPGGYTPYYLKDGTPILPESSKLVPSPSLRIDQKTDLYFRPGFIRYFDGKLKDFDGYISIGEIDVANVAAMNQVCGENVTDVFLRKMADISREPNSKVRLFRHGGDEFSFVIFGASKEANESVIAEFIARVNKVREDILDSLPPQEKAILTDVCEKKRIAKNRPTAAPALGLYVGMVTIEADSFRNLAEKKEANPYHKGIVAQSFLGQAEKVVYEIKASGGKNIISQDAVEDWPMRSADIMFVNNLRVIDERHDEIVKAFEDPRALSRAERIILAQELIRVGTEDISINNGTARWGRLKPEMFRFAIDPEKSSEVYFDFPVGVLNDLKGFGPDRTDEMFGWLLSYLPLDYQVFKIRESGGGFKLLFPVNTLTDNELKDLHELLYRRVANYLAVSIQNINTNLIEENQAPIDYISPDLLYVGRTPRPKA